MPDTALPEPSATIRSKGRTTASGSSEKTETARKLHFVLQGKGGVGKTVVALLLSQCIEEKGEPVICVDTDPVNASLSSLSVDEPGAGVDLCRQEGGHPRARSVHREAADRGRAFRGGQRCVQLRAGQPIPDRERRGRDDDRGRPSAGRARCGHRRPGHAGHDEGLGLDRAGLSRRASGSSCG